MFEKLIIRQLGLYPYEEVLRAMRCFTYNRSVDSIDEVWLVQHPRVFTQGRAGKAKHLIEPGDIPVVQSDRGGQVTFHGPGQQLMYFLLNLHRLQLGVRNLVILLEKIVSNTLEYFSISSQTYESTPGVYVGKDKICSLGLRIHRGYSFHGFALNVNMDLSPFLRINPCGYSDLRMTQISDLSPGTDIDDVTPILIKQCLKLFNANIMEIKGWNPKNYKFN